MPDLGSLFRTLPALMRSVARAVPLSLRLLRRDVYGPWGLIGEDGWFRGVGSFHSRADEPLDATSVHVRRFEYEPARKRIIAEIVAGGGDTRLLAAAVPGVLIIDTRACEPLALRYDSATTVTRAADRIQLELALPALLARDPGRWKAHLLLDVTPLAEISLRSN
jgi:hypothetical protein